MTNTEFLKALEKALSRADKGTRNEILDEIKSYADEPDAGPLHERFGSPQKLAAQYLEDIPTRTSAVKKASNFMRYFLMALGVLVLVIGLSVYYLARKYSKDDFNYADQQLLRQHQQQHAWLRLDGETLTFIDASQSKVVIYWHDEGSILYHCAAKESPLVVESTQLSIHQDDCLISLPRSVEGVKVNQSDVAMMGAPDGLKIDAKQSRVRIDTQDGSYGFNIVENIRSKVIGLESSKTASVMIDVSAERSEIRSYVAND